MYSGKRLVNFSKFKKPILIGRFSNGIALYGSNANDTVNDDLANVVCINFVFGGAEFRKSRLAKGTNAEPFDGVLPRNDSEVPILPIHVVA